MLITYAVFAATLAAPPPHSQMPPGMTHEQHLKQLEKEAALKKRGAAAMGFDQDAARHVFNRTADGGSIAVDARDAADVTTRDQIRAHLKQVAAAFAKGDFSKPFQTHAEVPPGVPVMTEKRDAIVYAYSDTPNGGIVRIQTRDPQALDAIHAFLEYQRKAH